jgi:probable F420-dependent oxidoreductase
MKIGVVYPQTELKGDPDSLRRFGLAAESLGFNHIVGFDHIVGASHEGREPSLFGPYNETHPFHDPIAMFCYWAAITERIEFATGILILPQRQTVLVAKQTADLDLLSHQRLRLGVGIGWNYVEYQALGQDFKTRGRRVDEQIGYLRRLWTEPLLTFHGEFDHLDAACLIPRPKRSIPIWIGGFSEAAFERGARVGDGYIFALKFEKVLEGLQRVNYHLAQMGRSTETFGKELVLQSAKTPAQAVEHIKVWQDHGGTHASVDTMRKGLDSVDAHIDFMGEVLHRFHG